MMQNRKNGYEKQVTWSRRTLSRERKRRNGNDSDCYSGAERPL